jgi:branched-chain amino acid transport system permease protein
MGSVWGVIVGGAILAWLNVEGLANIGTWLNEHTPLNVEVAKYEFGIYGIIIVLMMLFRPIGLIPERRRKRELEEGPSIRAREAGAYTTLDAEDAGRGTR